MKPQMITKCRQLFQCNPELWTNVCLDEYLIFYLISNFDLRKYTHIKVEIFLYLIDKKEVAIVESKKYMKRLVEQANLHFIVTGKIRETGLIITAMKVVTLRNPKLIIEV